MMCSQASRRASLLDWRPWLVALFLMSASGQASQETSAQPFNLDQIAAQFPSQGFENEIAFWTRIFTFYGEGQIVFHDRDDLRIIYQTADMGRGIRADYPESRRQRKILRSMQSDLVKRLREVSRYGPGSDRLNREHLELVQTVRSAGLKPTQKLFRRLSQGVRYQRGVREKFLEGLIRSGRYLDRIEQIFRSYDLPVELALMPHLESSFDYSAYSKVGAAGIWQFMRSTGRRFLTVNRTIDERRDPLMATDAAARYLQELHQLLGSWPLAVTAYNHGENGMARAKKRYGSDFRTIVDNYKSRLFGFASKNFYPELLAAVEVARNCKAYFGDIEIDQPEEFDTLPLKHSYPVSLIEKAGGLDRDVLKSYNPHLTRYVWERSRQVPAGFQLRLPPGSGKGVEQALARYKPSGSPLSLAADGSMLYRVRPGNTLGQIAANFGISVRTLQRWNDIKNPHSIRVGELLVVSRGPSQKGGGQSRYRVRRGDSLALIAKKFQTTVGQLVALNSLDNPNQILPGQMLVVR